jgi:pimeloyl-ACP methyl ester carboxylesterase
MQAIAKVFGVAPILFGWSGANSAQERHAAARNLAEFVRQTASLVHLVGFSHGGNIASEAAAVLSTAVDLLVTIATPVTGNYKLGGARRHFNLYSPQDRMQILGGEGPLGIPNLAKRGFREAINVPIHGIKSSDITGSHGNILWSDQTWSSLAEHIDSVP